MVEGLNGLEDVVKCIHSEPHSDRSTVTGQRSSIIGQRPTVIGQRFSRLNSFHEKNYSLTGLGVRSFYEMQ
jgi:hypothetical protein